MKVTKSQLKQIIKEEIQTVQEGRFDELKKAQQMLNNASVFFIKLADELEVDPRIVGDFNQARNSLLDAVFKADHQRTGGKID
jgi:hypothetical protein